MNAFMLLVVIILSDGSEMVDVVSGVRHPDAISCNVERVQRGYQDSPKTLYFCDDISNYIKRDVDYAESTIVE